MKLSTGLEPASMNLRSLAGVGSLLIIELDALNASGASTDYAPLPLLSANLMAETAIACLGRGRLVNPPKYTARDWYVPPDSTA